MNQVILEKRLTRPRHSIYYRATIDDAGHVIATEAFDCRIQYIKDGDNTLVCVMDANGNLRRDVYEYINETRGTLHLGTKRQMATALQSFYTFCDIMCYDYQKITIAQIQEWMRFLLGDTVYPYEGSTKTIRTANTANQFEGMVKQYYVFKEWSLNAFLATKAVHTTTAIGSELPHDIIRRKDVNKLKTDPFKEMVIPKHVTPAQMGQIARLMRERNDFQSLILSHLQYSYGVRSGEALGLTEEDVTRKINDEGVDVPVIILRNRVSDRMDQSCKGLYHPKSKEQYRSSLYKGSQWEIEISEKTYHALMRFIAFSRETKGKSETVLKNMEEHSIADNVTGSGLTNHYIFLSRTGRRLSGQTWNDHLGEYFTSVGITLDEGFRKNGCSHRLRHGFAMYHAQYSGNPMNILQLQKALRHASPFTCRIYYTPLPSDERELRNRFQEEIETIIPDFTWVPETA